VQVDGKRRDTFLTAVLRPDGWSWRDPSACITITEQRQSSIYTIDDKLMPEGKNLKVKYYLLNALSNTAPSLNSQDPASEMKKL